MFSVPGAAADVDKSARAVGVGVRISPGSAEDSVSAADVEDAPDDIGCGVSELSILTRVGRGVATSETPSGRPAPADIHSCQSFDKVGQSVDQPGIKAKPATSPTNTIDPTPSRMADHGLLEE